MGQSHLPSERSRDMLLKAARVEPFVNRSESPLKRFTRSHANNQSAGVVCRALRCVIAAGVIVKPKEVQCPNGWPALGRRLLRLVVVVGIIQSYECSAGVTLTPTGVSLSVWTGDTVRTTAETALAGPGEGVRIQSIYEQTCLYVCEDWKLFEVRELFSGGVDSGAKIETNTQKGSFSYGWGQNHRTITQAGVNRGTDNPSYIPGSSEEVYNPFQERYRPSPFPKIAVGDAYIYKVGRIGFSGQREARVFEPLAYTAQFGGTFEVAADEPLSRVFITQHDAPGPIREPVVSDSGLLYGLIENYRYQGELAMIQSMPNDPVGASWKLNYYVYAVVPLPSVTINVTSGTQTQAQAGYSTLINAPIVTKTGPGTLVMDNANPYTGTTTVSEGTLTITNPLAVQSSPLIVRGGGIIQLPKNTPIVVPTKTIEVDVASGGRIDVGVGLINCFPPNGAGDGWLVDWISAGRDGGSWQGAGGITSSAVVDDAAEGKPRAVGWKKNEDGSVTVGYAAPGDTNLDGEVNIFDLVNVNSSGTYGRGVPSNWSQGDFDYNGVTNIFDIVMVNGAGVYGRGRYVPAPASGSVAAVPEPSTCIMALAGIACGGHVVRRRRKQA